MAMLTTILIIVFGLAMFGYGQYISRRKQN